MRRYIFYTIKDIRNKEVEELSDILRKKLLEENNNNFDSIFYLHQGNKIFVRYILARITDFVERASGLEGKFSDYMTKGRKGYEIEHIWANNYDWFRNDFPSSNDFSVYRNRIGGLLLLPRSFNASYSDIRYEEKVEHYIKNNILAQSLNKKCYEHNPGFKSFMEKYNLPFKPYECFDKKALDERQELYSKLAKLVWSPDRLII
jgi:hypothetical protein